MGRKRITHIGMVFLLLFSLILPTGLTANAAVKTTWLTVEDAIANNIGSATVRGYIVGYINGPGNVAREAKDDLNLAVASTPTETDSAKMLFVQLPASLRAEWGLKTNPDLLDQQVDLTGDLEKYHGNAGMKSTSSIMFADGEQPPVEEAVTVEHIEEARALPAGTLVTVHGTVTAKLKNSITIQDGTAGIALRPNSLGVDLGDDVTVTGKVAEYRGLMQIDNAQLIERASGTVPEAKQLTGEQVGESVESQLVTVHNVVLTDKEAGPGWANYAVGTADYIVRDENDELSLQAGMTYDSITGIVQQFDDTYQLIPRFSSDVIEDSTVVQPVTADPGSGTFIDQVEVALRTGTADAQLLYTIDGSDPENGSVYNGALTFTEDTVLKAVAKTSDGRTGVVQTYEYKITDALQIHDIQGTGHVSPFEGQTVEGIEGIVTYKYVLQGSTYYHIQAPDDKKDGDLNTSEAIVLYSGKDKWNLAVGNLVKVKGKVSEYAIDGYSDRQQTDLKTTQISVRDDQGGIVEVIDENVPLPEPFKITEENLPKDHILSAGLKEFDVAKYAGDFWESREAMLVEVGDVKSVGPQMHGDLTTIFENRKADTVNGGILLKKDKPNADLIQFRLEPNNEARDFEVATGDKFKGPIVGVVGYSFQNYKIYVDYGEMKSKFEKGSAKPAVTKIEKQEGKLTIAAYNLENFSNNKKSTSDDKAGKLARAFANDMHNPDIIGVTEVQDNDGPDAGGPEANESYERLIQAIKDAGGATYEYVNIDPIHNQDGGQPNANIRVGFLYNPERVSFKKVAAHGDATTPVEYKDGSLTRNPGRIDPKNEAFRSSRKPLAAEFTFQGDDVIVIANHWNSKGGDTPLFGAVQPPVYNSELQRKKIAQIVHDFVADIKQKNPYANVVALGDFNDFQFTDSLEILEGDIMTNLVKTVPEESRYSYVFQGNSQVLDHVVVSNNLVEKAEIDMLHVNADYTDMAGRASDHDPVLVQLALVKAPLKAEKFYNFNSFKTTRLLINKPSVDVQLDGQSVIRQELQFTGHYGKFTGEGFTNTTVRVKPVESGAVVDFAGTTVKKVIVDGQDVKEIRGAENIQEIEYVNGASADQVKILDMKGEPIMALLFSCERVMLEIC